MKTTKSYSQDKTSFNHTLRTKRAKETKLETIMNRLSELEQNNKSETEEAIKLNEEAETLKEELTIDENIIYSIDRKSVV